MWLDKRLADAATNADEVVHAEHQEQGAMNVSVRNINIPLADDGSEHQVRIVLGKRDSDLS
ncbi:MAG: hypothetical protein ACRD37_09980 [Candidatus Acidiferrales bacterium]